MRTPTAGPLLVATVLIAACGGENTPSRVEAPGAEPAPRTRALEAGTALMQRREPVGALDVYVNGFHFYNGNLSGQVEAHHYCSVVNEDVRQCVLFDGNGRDAKLVGIEYIVSRRIFERLPAAERRLWHSHDYEVRSGTLVAPGIPAAAEHMFMEEMVGTYGKTWHTWHTDRGQDLPVGHPMLMAGLTSDDQVDPKLLAARDERLRISSADRRRARADIDAPERVPGANSWEQGEVLQLVLQPVEPEASLPHFEPQRDEANAVPPPFLPRGRHTRDTPRFAFQHD
jgi:hypothetical protein